MEYIHIEPITPALTATEYSIAPDQFYLFVLYTGRGTLAEQAEERTCRAPLAFWNGPGFKGKMRLNAGSRGCLLRLSSFQLQTVLPEGQVAGFVQRAVSETTLVPLDKDIDRSAVTAMLELLQQSSAERDPMSAEIVRHGVTQLLCRLLKSMALMESRKNVLPRRVVHEFCRLVDQNLYLHWPVARYAEEIGVSRDHLQSAVRRALAKSPLEYIHARLLDRAAGLLRNSDLTVTEVAYRLGFSDAAYFSRFFKRQTGIAPGRYRKEAHVTADFEINPPTFASWP